MSVRIKRIYEPHQRTDGIRILVDRLWPRGISKTRAHIDEWLKEVAPSDRLRKWYGHTPALWGEFRERYWQELQSPEKQELFRHLQDQARKRTVTLLFASRNEEYNNARALAEFLLKVRSNGPGPIRKSASVSS